MHVTVADIFEQTVKKYPGKEAIYDVRKEERWNFREWDRLVNRAANAFLEAGIGKGDRVSTFLYNGIEFVTIYFACAKIGAVFNPVNFRLKSEELSYILADVETKLLIYEHALEEEVQAADPAAGGILCWSIDRSGLEYAELYEDRIRRSSDECPPRVVTEQDIYAVMYSSGTTGRPKGVVHRHREAVDQSMGVIGVMKYDEYDIGIIASPLFHCGELHSGFLARVHAGSTNIILPKFHAKEVLRLIHDEKVTMVGAVPTAWKMLLQEDRSQFDHSTLRIGMYGGEAMKAELVREVIDAFDIDLVQAYGMTEMGPGIAYLYFPRKHPPLDKAGSAGKAVFNHEIRIARLREDGPSDPDDVMPDGEVGEIIVRGCGMMAGYLNQEQATKEALYRGWYHSGDLGYMDEDGYLWLVDRRNNMIVSGGENIYPREVEFALMEHPGVKDVAVVGAPDPKWGETVVAFVVPIADSVKEQELDAFCKERIAWYKRPRRYLFIEELPRNSAGKVLYPALRQAAANTRETDQFWGKG